jgi:hypothetical protein
MAAVLFVLATVIITSCKNNDVDNTGHSSRSYAKSTENSTLTVDDYTRVATLGVTVTNTDPEGNTLAPRKGEAVAKLSANVETNPLQTSIMEKEFGQTEIETSEVNGAQLVDFSIKINDGNTINGTVNITSCIVYDNAYTLKVNAIEVDKQNVKVTDTHVKSSAEKSRQIVTVPLKVTVESVGTQEAHTGVIPATVQYEQFQLRDDVTFDHYEIDNAIHTITEGKDEYTVTVASVWSDGSKTTQEYKYATTHYFNTISLEDVYVKAFAYALSKIEGLTVGTESFVKNSEDGRFAEYSREDIYSALHDHEGNPQIKSVYFAGIPKVIFSIGEGEKKVEYVFDFISANFVENSDDILNATSAKTGYEMKIFRNAVTASYGNQETGIDSKVLEERANLYKAEQAVVDIISSNIKKSYTLFKIQYDVDVVKVYNDGTKSGVEHLTYAQPWSLTYLGPWSLVAKGDVSQSTTALAMSKSGSNVETQNIANGKWTVTKTSYNLSNNTTVDGQTKKNSATASVPTRVILTYYGKDIDFGEDVPSANATGASISLTDKTATQENYRFSEQINFTVGDKTANVEAYGLVTKAVEKTLTGWEWVNTWYDIQGNTLLAHVEKHKIFNDGSEETIKRDFKGVLGSQVYTYFETTEANNSETTGAPQLSLLNSTASTSGDWKFDLKKYNLTFGVTCANSTQIDGFNLTLIDKLSVEVDGDVYTFEDFDFTVNNSTNQSKENETAEKTTYKHSNTAVLNIGNSSMNLGTATGLIFVNKVVTPESHDGFFPKEYGKIKGNKNIACLASNRNEWGVGAAIEFENGTLPIFITKNGEIQIDKSLFKSGVHNAIGSCYDNKGNLQIVTSASNASTMMMWKNGSTVNFITYADARQIGFNWGDNHVETNHFASSIEQKDGGKWQVITFSGARYSVTLDSSF